MFMLCSFSDLKTKSNQGLDNNWRNQGVRMTYWLRTLSVYYRSRTSSIGQYSRPGC